MRSCRLPLDKLNAIKYLSSDAVPELAPHIVESLSELYNYFDAKGERIRYQRKTMRRAREIIAKCRVITDLPDIVKLCDSIESQIPEVDR